MKNISVLFLIFVFFLAERMITEQISENFEVFTFGRPPVSIDIMTKVKGLSFIPTFDKSIIYETNGVKIRLIHYNSLIKAKKSSARLKDLNDIQHLQEE